jgi:nucleoside-diphosphate-sugar epimerase
MTRVLLFGGSGFIGRHVLEALRHDSRVRDIVLAGRSRYDLVNGDPADLALLVKHARPDAVVNCTGRLTGSLDELAQANTAATARLVDALAANAPGIRFVRLGSAAEYGKVPFGHAVTEYEPARPVSDYGVSHLAGTRLVQVASAAGRVDGVVLRVFNPVGPGLREDNVLGRAAIELRAAIHSGAEHVELGPLDAYRDLVDVRDVASAVTAAVLAPTLRVRVLNVGSGRAVPVRQAVELLARVAGFAGDIREVGNGSERSGGVTWMRANLGRIGRVLGWAPTYDLADSMKAIWADTTEGK